MSTPTLSKKYWQNEHKIMSENNENNEIYFDWSCLWEQHWGYLPQNMFDKGYKRFAGATLGQVTWFATKDPSGNTLWIILYLFILMSG